MLEALRKGAGGWVAKIFLGLLVLSFAVWGIADIFTGYGSRTVASVGSTEIDPYEFQRTFQTETQRFGRQIGRPLALNEARSLGLDRQVLSQLLSEATLDEDALQKGLNVSNDKIAGDIVSDPQFSNALNTFSRPALDSYLSINGLSEEAYVADRTATARRIQLGEAIAGGAELTETMRRAIHTFQNETRSARYVTLNADDLPAPEAPNETDLSTYFEANKAQFAAPEYRGFSYVVLEPASIASGIELNDDELRAAYDERLGTLSTPERRTVRQIPFDTEDEASAARARITAEFTFDDLATERELTAEDMALGTVTQDELLDPAVAEAAFALQAGTTSQAVKGRFRPLLVTVDEITPGNVPEFEEVKAQLRTLVATERASETILDVVDAIEDDRAAGLTLKEIAGKNALFHIEVPALDRNGRDPDGAIKADLPISSQLIAGVFDADVGVETDLLQVGAEGSLWYEVTDVTPARDRTLDEVRDRVIEAWTADQLQSQLAEKTADMIERINGGATLDDVATEDELVITRSAPLKRTDTSGDLSPAAIETLFAQSEGKAFDIAHSNARDRLVVVVGASRTPDFNAEDEASIAAAERLSTGLIDDLLTQYIAERQADFGTSINQTALDLALGISPDDHNMQ